MNVSLIGSGNLAWHLAPALDNAGYPIAEVYSRHTDRAAKLVERLYDARVRSTLDFSDSTSRIFLMAVSDDVIPEVADDVVLPENAFLVHTSGSQPLDVLIDARGPRTGVFYPLQTFTKDKKADFSVVPIFVESKDRETERVLLDMANAISKKVFRISSSQRQALHVAAVFASNFTNHMITLSRDILQEHKLDFEWLKPLLVETINKSLSLGPESAQTGPAKRGDLEILDRHLEFLKNDEEVAEIYRVVSQNILDRYDVG